jgi:AraC-like DNA-binding protein
MPLSRPELQRHVLKGYEPAIVRTSREAHALSERLFARLDSFTFDTPDDARLITSGPQNAQQSVRLVSSSGHRITIRDDDKLSILFPYRGIIQVARGDEVETARPSEMLVVRPGGRETRLSRGYLGALIQLSQAEVERLDRRWIDAGDAARRDGWVTRMTDAGVLARLQAFMTDLEATPRSQLPSWPVRFAAVWDALALGPEPGLQPATSTASLDHVRRAEEFMVAHYTESFDLTDVARAVGVGPRSLQLAFHRHRRGPPLRFLFEYRLREARRRFSAAGPDATVTSIALECGFTHLGRFSEAYSRIYGEAPSRTLQKSTVVRPAADQ